jgi:hypothetical protein
MNKDEGSVGDDAFDGAKKKTRNMPCLFAEEPGLWRNYGTLYSR